MKLSITLNRPILKVVSSIFSDLAAAWIVAIFLTRDIFVLTVNVLAVIVSVYIAIKIEEVLEDYD